MKPVIYLIIQDDGEMYTQASVDDELCRVCDEGLCFIVEVCDGKLRRWHAGEWVAVEASP